MRAIHRLKSILRDSAGNVMPIAAAGMVVAVALVGSGVDMSRAYLVKSRLQAACDAGVLAGRRSVISDGFDEPSQTAAGNYFKANFNDAQQGTRNAVFTATSDDEGKTINGTATAVLDTAVMRAFTINQFNLRVNCSSTMGVGNSDIVMVLDTTGSMGGSRISALKTAMKNFYDTVAKSTDGSNARIRYGFVPYSSSVNVGKLIYKEDPDYLADYWEYQTRIPDFETVDATDYTEPFDTYGSVTIVLNADADERYDVSTEYTSDSTCKTMRNNLNAAAQWVHVSDEPLGDPQTVVQNRKKITTTTLSSDKQSKPVYKCVSYKNAQNKTRYYVVYNTNYQVINSYRYDTRYALLPSTSNGPFREWRYLMWGLDVRKFKTGAATEVTNGDGGVPVSYTWKGCIEERSTTNSSSFSFTPGVGIQPKEALDLDIDKIPTSDPDTKWAPTWPEMAYLRGTWEWVNGKYTFRMGGNPEYSQGDNASSPCPAEAQLLTTYSASSASDKKAFYDYADKLQATGNTYHDIGMIWGGRLSSPDGIFADNVNDTPNNGGAVSRHIIFMTDGQMEPNNTAQSAYDIEYYRRRITTNGSSGLASRHTSRFLAVCEAVKSKGIRLWVIAFGTSMTTDLETCASEESSFTAADAGGLNTAFQEIAKQVGELRVSQ